MHASSEYHLLAIYISRNSLTYNTRILYIINDAVYTCSPGAVNVIIYYCIPTHLAELSIYLRSEFIGTDICVKVVIGGGRGGSTMDCESNR